jgi:pectate lyase
MKSLMAVAVLVSLVSQLPPAEKIVPAFPGAEGFGANTTGGRGGKVIFVENLNDSGPGSLREALETRGPRYILFKVSGVIELEKSLEIRRGDVTIAGQSAPGDGICIKNFDSRISAKNVVVRHIRFRPGDEPAAALKERGRNFEPDALTIARPSSDVIVDHCSASWSTDECLTVSGEGITNVTVQWCIISESLNQGAHHKGNHGFGSLIRTNGNVTYHHNLYAHHRSRCPRPGTYGDGSILFDFRNNVVFDGNGYSAGEPTRLNYVGNYIRKPNGPAFKIGGDATAMFQTANYQEDAGEKNDDFWQLVPEVKPVNMRDEAFEVASVTTDSADNAYEAVLESAGATLPKRDAVDARVVQEVRDGKVGLVNSQAEVGGWPAYRSEKTPKDSDNDGMPDEWEAEHGLKPNRADHNGDADGDGYPNLEEWLNGTEP